MYSGMTTQHRGTIELMTNQVMNVTDTNDADLSEEELYDKEWAEDEAPDQGQSDHPPLEDNRDSQGSALSNQEKAEDTGSATSRTVSEGLGSDTPDTTKGTPSGGSTEEDIWAAATEAQRLAFLKAQNDFNSMSGRARAEQQRRADLEKELEKERAEKARLTRQKGTYETEHPELFDEVLNVLKSEQGFAQPTQPASPNQSVVDAGVKTVLQVHPDAQDLMQSDEWSGYVSSLDSNQRALLESDNPYEFIDLLNSFKTDRAVKAALKATSTPVNEDDLLSDSITAKQGSASRAQVTGSMSDEEAYDAEWANDS